MVHLLPLYAAAYGPILSLAHVERECGCDEEPMEAESSPNAATPRGFAYQADLIRVLTRAKVLRKLRESRRLKGMPFRRRPSEASSDCGESNEEPGGRVGGVRHT